MRQLPDATLSIPFRIPVENLILQLRELQEYPFNSFPDSRQGTTIPNVITRREAFNSFPDSRKQGNAVVIVTPITVFQFLSGFQMFSRV